MVIKFDGKGIWEHEDLPRIVGGTPVDKDVEVVIIRNGQEESKAVKLSRADDLQKQLGPAPQNGDFTKEKSIVQKTFGLHVSNLMDIATSIRNMLTMKVQEATA